MSMSGIVTICLGLLIICSRGPLIFVPASVLAWFRAAIKTKNRTRGLGAIVGLVSLPMIWSGMSEDSELALFLLIFGGILLFISIAGLLLFPHFYMSIAEIFIAEDPDSNLFGWRIIGLVAVIIGSYIVWVGMNAL
jgi:hypothetical protein